MLRERGLRCMGGAERAYRDAGGHRNEDNPADPYMTVVGYFNSLRELGGAGGFSKRRSATRSRATGSAQAPGRRPGLFQDRKTFSEVIELTSRVSTDKVAEARRRLECHFTRKQRVDCAIATNMISVGLDITAARADGRLRPAQDTLRIHPGHQPRRPRRKRPGLVVTLLNIHRPSDRSHYERFRHYHETFYRSVEVASVTPFSARALDRGLVGALVTLARHAEPAMTAPLGAEHIAAERAELERQLLDTFMDRLRQQPATDSRTSRSACGASRTA